MTPPDLDRSLAVALADRQLLDHPFYRRWEDGGVSRSELAAYAAQYRHFENYLPEFLEALVAGLPEGPARALIAENLADERGDPIAHTTLFERFAVAVGAEHQDPSPATSNLLATYAQLLAESPDAALAGFVAYESQAAVIADRKADGLRRHHGLDHDGVAFWEHHRDVDIRHAQWARRAMADCSEPAQTLVSSAVLAADAWWTFLDEREEFIGCR